MMISQAIRYELYKRADGRCECMMRSCDHIGKRCTRGLSLGLWDAHPRTADGPNTLNNLIAMCPICHKTHGRVKEYSPMLDQMDARNEVE
jgi:hypothetical protein